MLLENTPRGREFRLMQPGEERYRVPALGVVALPLWCGDEIEITTGDTFSLKCKDFVLKADNSIKVTTGTEMTVKTGTACGINGGQQLTLRAAMININNKVKNIFAKLDVVRKLEQEKIYKYYAVGLIMMIGIFIFILHWLVSP